MPQTTVVDAQSCDDVLCKRGLWSRLANPTGHTHQLIVIVLVGMFEMPSLFLVAAGSATVDARIALSAMWTTSKAYAAFSRSRSSLSAALRRRPLRCT